MYKMSCENKEWVFPCMKITGSRLSYCNRNSCLRRQLMAQGSSVVLNGTTFLLVSPSLAHLVWPFALFLIPGDRFHDCPSTGWHCYIWHSVFQFALSWLCECFRVTVWSLSQAAERPFLRIKGLAFKYW